MAPSLRHGQVVVVGRLGQVRPGLVVVANDGNRLVVKRVVDVKSGMVRLAGDNRAQSTDPGWVKTSTLLFRLVWPRLKRGV